jgi:copper chaperone CopZ
MYIPPFPPRALLCAQFVYNVKMTCGGCSGAVERVLKAPKNAAKVEKHEISMDDQTVTVWCDIRAPPFSLSVPLSPCHIVSAAVSQRVLQTSVCLAYIEARRTRRQMPSVLYSRPSLKLIHANTLFLGSEQILPRANLALNPDAGFPGTESRRRIPSQPNWMKSNAS